MKKFFFAAACIITINSAIAQTEQPTPTPSADTTSVISVTPIPVEKPKKTWTKIDLSNRSNDHVMIQFGADTWTGTPDSISTKGFSRFFNAYIMLDKPFKTNPKFSVGLGVGIGSSNMFFDKTYVDVKAQGNRLPFQRVDSINHFKKFKLTTVFLEAPVELRYSSDPEHSNSSFKVAIGAKIGTLLKAYTKGKNLEDKNGNLINSYVAKESSKKFFNSTRLAGTLRIGYGIVSLFGSYQITSILKDGTGPDIKPYSIGLTISGL
jgi:hypothetical protein